MLRIIPKEEKFFDLFVMQAENTLEGAQLLKDLFADYTDFNIKLSRIKKVESHGDGLTHKIIEKLNTTFVTPIDSEDIHLLTSALDDILDLIYSAAQRMGTYRIKEIHEPAHKMVDIILLSCEEIVNVMKYLKTMKNNAAEIKNGCIEINRLENEADDVSRDAIGDLFDNEPNPIEIMKWKEIYEYLEDAADMCEDAANAVETILLKNM